MPFGEVMKRTKRLQFLILTIFCFGQGFANVHYFQPPALSIDEPYIDVPLNSTLELACEGNSPLLWKVQRGKDFVNDSRVSIVSFSNDSSVPAGKYRTKLTVEGLDFNDTGFYTCCFEGTADATSPQNSASIYVFVNDPGHLFVENSAMMAGHLIIAVHQHRKAVVPCLPTSSRVNVSLWKTEDEERFQQVALGEDVTFDPLQGFLLYYPTFYFSGSFQCKAETEERSEEINVSMIFFPETNYDPQPFVDATGARHPVVNGTFALKCVVNIDLATHVFVNWTYPNRKDIQGRLNITNPTLEYRNSRGFAYKEVYTYLTVKEVRTEDSGRYVCSVTDHSNKTGTAEATVFVHETQMPAHVNFTTDVNMDRPTVLRAGEQLKFVVTVEAYPSMADVQLFWEKDGQLLLPDGHCDVSVEESLVILEINQLRSSDAGIYTLFGRTRDRLSKISLHLEVKDKPVVTVQGAEPIYALGKEYHLQCLALGYPAPIVWWRWKPCQELNGCGPGGSYGWTDVEPNKNLPNKDNVTLEYADDSSSSLVSHLHASALQSGHYMCVASNMMGKDDFVVPFIVTDAENGFEVSISKRRPVDKDYVQVVCKVSAFNFTQLTWTWRPMHSAQELKTLENMTEVELISEETPYSLSYSIVFDPIHLNMSGEYECTARSQKNNMTISKHLTVDVRGIQRPALNKTNMAGAFIVTAPGTLQEFYCYVSGVPFPTVTWMKDGKTFNLGNVSGAELSEQGQKLTIKRVLERDSGFYQCMVENRGGRVVANATLDVSADERGHLPNGLTAGEMSAVVVFGIVGFIFIVVASCLVQRILKERKQQKELDFMRHNVFERGYIDIFNPNLPLEDQIDLLPYKQSWEFPRERLKLGKTLGQGAFGRVVKAEAIGLVEGEASTTVAVKMLKEAANAEQRKALVAELKILIHIGRHLNIVNLLGAVTKNLAKGELYVIVEYCCLGNLRYFLLKHKDSFIDQLDHGTGQMDPRFSTLPGSPFSGSVEDAMVVYSNMLGIGLDNPNYKGSSLHYADIDHQATTDSGTGTSVFTSPSGSSVGDRYSKNSSPASTPPGGDSGWCEGSEKDHLITTCDLLCFAFQCARGMEYLASRKLIHRDLAARNVLLAKDNVVKICDFGLAKDCYKYSNYIKKTNGLMPVKWMAIESIRDRVFTSKSDVWSFGILLWEIFTLGSNPYPGVEMDEEFYKRLKNGYRLERPELAPDKIYQLMQDCWLHDPLQRPDFTFLAENIGALLESSVRKYYVELNEPYQVMNEELMNNNDYLQMTGQNEEEYTNMNSSELKQLPEGLVANTYDNIPPEASVEAVPMIQLESISKDTISTMDGTLSPADVSQKTTYLNMPGGDSEEFDSVFEKKNFQKYYINGCLTANGEREVSTRC